MERAITDIRAIPEIRSCPHPIFLRECTDALTLCRNLSSFKVVEHQLAPFLLCIQDKPRLHALSINANLTSDQAAKTSQMRGLRRLTLEHASWQFVDILPKWVGSLQSTLTELTIHASRLIHPFATPESSHD